MMFFVGIMMTEFEDATILAEKKGKHFLKKGNKFLKVFPAGFSKAAVYVEALCQTQLESRGVYVPKVYGVSQIGDRLALIMDYIEDTGDSTLEQFVSIAVQMANTKIDILPHQTDIISNLLNRSGFSSTTKTNILKRIDSFSSMPLYTCHGDLHQKNIIVDHKGRLAVIDFEYTSKGNILLDVARTYILYEICGVANMAEEYINLFCKKMGYDVSDVKYLIPVAGALHFVLSTNEQKKKLLIPYIEQLARS